MTEDMKEEPIQEIVCEETEAQETILEKDEDHGLDIQPVPPDAPVMLDSEPQERMNLSPIQAEGRLVQASIMDFLAVLDETDGISQTEKNELETTAKGFFDYIGRKVP